MTIPTTPAKAHRATRPERKTANREVRAPAHSAGRTMRAAAELTELVSTAIENTLSFNPLIGVRRHDIALSARALARALVASPATTARQSGRYVQALRAIVDGTSAIAPDPKDRRFADPAWQTNPFYKRLAQTYAQTRSTLDTIIDGSGLDRRTRGRAHFFASLVLDAIAPSNTVLGNPAAVRKMVDTGGQNLVQGARNMLRDIKHNGGLPLQVDVTPFKLGTNLATTPGQVVHRSELFELIQYTPSTAQVHARPLLMSPPQVNKYYAIDLAPEKSLAKWVVDSGVQFFVMSWRNPTLAQCHWSLDDYVMALDEAVDVVRRICRSPDVNMWGTCSGGMTLAAYLGWLAARNEKKVSNVTWAVCILDTREALDDCALGLFNTPETIQAAKARSRRRGIVTGAEMASMFAWLRPNDLIWNYWVNNYLLGNQPPAFDVLAWNSDTTSLPGQFHCDLLDLIEKNPYANPGVLQVAGERIDIGKVRIGAYVVAGAADHITPWRGCYGTARLFGPGTVFVLSNAGHLQSLLNPPGSAKSHFVAGPAAPADAQAWLEGSAAARCEGSWWPHWREWIRRHSGPQVPAAKRLGSRTHRPLCAAPGLYVLER